MVEQIIFGLLLVGILVWGTWSRFDHRNTTPMVDDDPEVRYARHLKNSHDDKDTP
jgi:hypothetical protein